MLGHDVKSVILAFDYDACGKHVNLKFGGVVPKNIEAFVRAVHKMYGHDPSRVKYTLASYSNRQSERINVEIFKKSATENLDALSQTIKPALLHHKMSEDEFNPCYDVFFLGPEMDLYFETQRPNEAEFRQWCESDRKRTLRDKIQQVFPAPEHHILFIDDACENLPIDDNELGKTYDLLRFAPMTMNPADVVINRPWGCAPAVSVYDMRGA
jgi:hypothetical protein